MEKKNWYAGKTWYDIAHIRRIQLTAIFIPAIIGSLIFGSWNQTPITGVVLAGSLWVIGYLMVFRGYDYMGSKPSPASSPALKGGVSLGSC